MRNIVSRVPQYPGAWVLSLKKKQNYFKGYLRFHSEIDTPNRETQRIQYEIPDGKTVYAVCAQDMGIHVQYPQKCNFNDL